MLRDLVVDVLGLAGIVAVAYAMSWLIVRIPDLYAWVGRL